jgi:hypothetical protein
MSDPMAITRILAHNRLMCDIYDYLLKRSGKQAEAVRERLVRLYPEVVADRTRRV